MLKPASADRIGASTRADMPSVRDGSRPAAQEIRKLPFREISRPMSGKESIVEAAGSTFQRLLWPRSCRWVVGPYDCSTRLPAVGTLRNRKAGLGRLRTFGGLRLASAARPLAVGPRTSRRRGVALVNQPPSRPCQPSRWVSPAWTHTSNPCFFIFLQRETRSIPRISAERVRFPPVCSRTQRIYSTSCCSRVGIAPRLLR